MANCSTIENNHEIHIDELKEIINHALQKTQNDGITKSSNYNLSKAHHIKSQIWVKCFALELECYYNKMGYDLVSFYNSRESQKKSSLNDVKEFLFDITVAKMEKIENSSLSFISKPIWQIESEFDERLKETIRDFQKLISGNAPLKMMIGPFNPGNNSLRYRKITRVPAYYVTGKLYYLFITHPEKWKKNKQMIWKLYKWNGRDWSNSIAEDEWII